MANSADPDQLATLADGSKWAAQIAGHRLFTNEHIFQKDFLLELIGLFHQTSCGICQQEIENLFRWPPYPYNLW